MQKLRLNYFVAEVVVELYFLLICYSRLYSPFENYQVFCLNLRIINQKITVIFLVSFLLVVDYLVDFVVNYSAVHFVVIEFAVKLADFAAVYFAVEVAEQIADSVTELDFADL